jgi:secreted trypsin-like serine protease
VGNAIFEGTVAQVSGWGSTDADKGSNNENLQILSVTITPCTLSTFPNDDRQPNTNSNICASVFTAAGGFCTTDVGGPLIVPSGLIGIASWHRTPCATNQVNLLKKINLSSNYFYFKDIYVRISWFRNWIGSITGV